MWHQLDNRAHLEASRAYRLLNATQTVVVAPTRLSWHPLPFGRITSNIGEAYSRLLPVLGHNTILTHPSSGTLPRFVVFGLDAGAPAKQSLDQIQWARLAISAGHNEWRGDKTGVINIRATT